MGLAEQPASIFYRQFLMTYTIPSIITERGTEMGATPTRDREMASQLIKRGYPHGRRFSKGLSNIPPLSESGSAASRRMTEKTRNAKPGPVHSGNSTAPKCPDHGTILIDGVCAPCINEGKQRAPKWWGNW